MTTKFKTALSIVLFATTVFTVNANANELSLREKLMDSGPVDTLYSVDDYHTLIKVSSTRSTEFTDELEKICSESGSTVERALDNSLNCRGQFNLLKVEESSAESEHKASFLLKHSAAQPVAYKNTALPSFEQIAKFPKGQVKGNYNSLDLYQYAYVLCKKESGVPAVVVPKRYGKYMRLTQVNSVEAFNYLLKEGEGKDSWLFACEGTKKFVLEKEPQYTPSEDKKFYFYQNRGLEGVDFVKSTDTVYLSRLMASEAEVAMAALRDNSEFIENMAWNLSNVKVTFVTTNSGLRFSGSVTSKTGKDCSNITIKQTASLTLKTDEKVYKYEVCNSRIARLDDRKSSPTFYAQLTNVLGK